MAKTFKLVPTIIIFLFFFLTTKEVVASNIPTILPTATKCECHKDCMTSYFAITEDLFICKNGYCLFLSAMEIGGIHKLHM
ncbi:unnamed protein product [Trifolium pratense]|uniref:Uncharacterized protein n=1 Tax=Trifolium pratense TaxID=57577 RepID=A0ACB0LCI3_TRIPR|nr:unnamed protein product [Trifolium pratense]